MERNDQLEGSAGENIEAYVLCLSIDLIGSTAAGLKLTTPQLNRFNISLANQIRPHLENLELKDALVKFTGDGWLVMTEKAKEFKALCCLATIMANKFQEEMNKRTGIAINKIPQLRLAICSGLDVSVELPNGHKDWVGDSARRATRACGWSHTNEVVINGTVREIALRDFDIKSITEKDHTKPKKWEEDFEVFSLGELNPEVSAEPEAPEYFIYTLKTIGKVEEANKFGLCVSECLGYTVRKQGIDEMERQEFLRNWNRLMASIPDYLSALKVFKMIQDAGLYPDVFTYSTLINKAPDYDVAKDWVETMRIEGIQPNVITYNTFINKAPDYDVAKDWIETMCAGGFQPNDVTYSTLFSKDLSGKLANDILKWYLAQKYHPEEPIQAAIATYQKLGRIDQVLRLVLDYPHLQSARKIIQEHSEEALQYFKKIFDDNPQHPNAAYALGVAYLELEKEQEAQWYLNKALKLATASLRKSVIKEWLRQIDHKQSQK
ncbi:MAG: hypothetical protein AEth_00957 [Candidatus Argoarchaeum ethanivorans]|uniref:Uncharacterized protein n=1 Tax=Candidatus Argoarchaeum ethanivorans TaxID=2608793 RepID=A0A8B3S473_9EURY|nr:MAG: hypothetical protein AEth_00957 [Candidatus Argoarchaeum ethanivorans]